MNSTLTPNMNLIIPTVGSELGPTYAFDINASLTLVDQHSHLPGAGVPIVPAAININSDLTFAANAATNLKYVGFYTQGSSPGISGGLYVKLGSEGTPRPDLWYNDGVTDVQITSAGNVNATAASIPGESYAGGTFTWKQGAGSTTPANFDIGSITIRPNTAATTNGVTLAPPAGISSAFTLALPTIPASTSFMQIDNSGNITASIAVTGGLDHTNLSSSAGITGSQLASKTITAAQIADATITATQIASATITGSQIASATILGGNIGSGTVTSGNLAPGLVLAGYPTMGSATPVIGPTSIGSNFFRTVMLSVRSSVIVSGPTQGVASYNSSNGVVTYTSAFSNTPVVVATNANGSLVTTAGLTISASGVASVAVSDSNNSPPSDFDLFAIGLHS